MTNTMQLALLGAGVVDEHDVARHQIREELKRDLKETIGHLVRQRDRLESARTDADRVLYRSLVTAGEETARELRRTIRDLKPGP